MLHVRSLKDKKKEVVVLEPKVVHALRLVIVTSKPVPTRNLINVFLIVTIW